jgi:hypothetical protein
MKRIVLLLVSLCLKDEPDPARPTGRIGIFLPDQLIAA